jgi:hypothetical protein
MAARAQTVQHVLLAPIAVPGQRLGVSWVGDATCSSVLCGRSRRTAPRAGAAQAGPAARGRLVSPVHPAAPPGLCRVTPAGVLSGTDSIAARLVPLLRRGSTVECA